MRALPPESCAATALSWGVRNINSALAGVGELFYRLFILRHSGGALRFDPQIIRVPNTFFFRLLHIGRCL